MSIGISGIGDIKAILETAWFLYRDCYKVAKEAPQDFKLLVDELSILRNSVKLIYEDYNDPRSTLRRSGESRLVMVDEMMRRIGATLVDLEKVARKYRGTLEGKSKSHRKVFWARIKWMVDAPDVNKLRNDLVYHNGLMGLLLNAAGNSSLARIEHSHARLEEDVGVIIDHLRRSNTLHGYSNGGVKSINGGGLPSINNTAIGEDGPFKLSLAIEFKKNAEEKQPWTTISASEWIKAGTWWLWRSQRDLYVDYQSGKKVISKRGFLNLIKASWILVDIIAVHPQVVFLPPNAQAELEQLSAALKIEFAEIEARGLALPELDDFDLTQFGSDLCIWQTTEKGLSLKPNLTKTRGTMGDQWAWASTGTDEHVIFQRFAMFQPHQRKRPGGSYNSRNDAYDSTETDVGSIPGMVLLLMHRHFRLFRVFVQDQAGYVLANIDLNDFKKYTSNAFPFVRLEGGRIDIDAHNFVFPELDDATMFSVLLIAITWYQSEFADWVPLHMETLRFLILIAGARFRLKTVLTNVPERTLSQAISQDHTPEEYEDLHEDTYRLSAEIVRELQGKVPEDGLRFIPRKTSRDDPAGYAARLEIGVSLIRYAVYLNQPDLVEVLCKLGVDVNFLHFNHETALFYAVHKGPSHAGVARILANYGAKTDRDIIQEEEPVPHFSMTMAPIEYTSHLYPHTQRKMTRRNSIAEPFPASSAAEKRKKHEEEAEPTSYQDYLDGLYPLKSQYGAHSPPPLASGTYPPLPPHPPPSGGYRPHGFPYNPNAPVYTPIPPVYPTKISGPRTSSPSRYPSHGHSHEPQQQLSEYLHQRESVRENLIRQTAPKKHHEHHANSGRYSPGLYSARGGGSRRREYSRSPPPLSRKGTGSGVLPAPEPQGGGGR